MKRATSIMALIAGVGSTTPLLLHRIGPLDMSLWENIMPSWDVLGARISINHDSDMPRIVKLAFPDLAPAIANMRTTIEVTDICRLALMYLHGGIYADLDQQLLDSSAMRKLVASGGVYLPFEKGRLVGQSILISPPGHPLWPALARAMVMQYDRNCYETQNTGPDKLTDLWNRMCARNSSLLHGVTLHKGLIKGPITLHHTTGSRTWKHITRKIGSVVRKAGCYGCEFRRAFVACTPSTMQLRSTITQQNALRLSGALRIENPVVSNITFATARRAAYNSALTVSGVRMNAREHFISRICDGGCQNGRHITENTLVVGDVECGAVDCKWANTREVRVVFAYSDTRQFFNGPEDARLDVVSNYIFAVANVPNNECGSSWAAQKMRDMAFIPLDGTGLGVACRISLPHTDSCRREKNWASLVVGETIFFVYSLVPFQVLRFDIVKCYAKPVTGKSTLKADLTIRGSTRYVHGLSVPEGNIYWAVVHSQKACKIFQGGGTRCAYDHMVAVILVRQQKNVGAMPDFELLGVTTPIADDDILQFYPKKDSFLYLHSILAYKNGVAEVTLHVNDAQNYRSRLLGVPHVLRSTYERYLESQAGSVASSSNIPKESICALVPPLKGNRPARVAMVSDFVLEDETARHAPWIERATASKACYAAKHGYAFFSHTHAKYTAKESAFVEPSLMQKTNAVRRLLSAGHEWAVWVDFDVLIMNEKITLESLMSKASGFDVITADGGDEVNAGIFAIRNSAGGFAFLEAYEHDAVRAAARGGHLPWRDNGYFVHAILRGLVEDAGITYKDECFAAGIRRNKGSFRRCFWRFRKTIHGLRYPVDIHGPPRGSRSPKPNLSSGAAYRVYMSSDGILNNLLSWPPPNNYQRGDLLLHFAGPNKSVVETYLEKAVAC